MSDHQQVIVSGYGCAAGQVTAGVLMWTNGYGAAIAPLVVALIFGVATERALRRLEREADDDQS